MIEVLNLTKQYGDHLALDDVSFTVEKGHIYGLLGPNGAGKSTTMNIITGYILPTKGSVSVNGFSMDSQARLAKKSIGYLPEIPPLYPDMSVVEYLTFVCSIKKVARAQRGEEVERVMSMTGITSVKQRLIKNLSKGYKQRVGIAQALVGSPEVIILDEPTVGLDPEQIIEIRELIAGLKEKHTVILSSHILSEVSNLCDEVLMIAKGKVVALDTTENILKMNRKAQKLILLLKGNREKIEAVFAKTECVESYSFVEADGEKCKFEVIGKEGNEDIREDLSFALAGERILILEMSSSLASLEDIYLEILQDVKENELIAEEKAKESEDDSEDAAEEDVDVSEEDETADAEAADETDTDCNEDTE